MKTKVLQIQRIILTSQDTIHDLGDRQRELQNEIGQSKISFQQNLDETQAYVRQSQAHTDSSLLQMHTEQRQNVAALQHSFTTSIQPLLTQMEQMTLAVNQSTSKSRLLACNAHGKLPSIGATQHSPAVRISATTSSQQCPSGCRCQCHCNSSIRTPPWLRSVFGQLLWTYSSSLWTRSCNYVPCQKSLGKHQFTYYFPAWLVSRAVVATANLDGLLGAGAKISVNIPLIIPEENHIVWSLVIAGNLEQLRHLLSLEKNLIYARNQWGQSIMHVSNTLNIPKPSVIKIRLRLL